MTDRARMEKTLREAYAARARGNVEGILKLFTPDGSFSMAGSSDMSPVAMRVEGHESLRAALEGLTRTFQMEDHEMLAMLIDGERAAVHWRATIRSTVTGTSLQSELCDLVEFKDGRIASFHQFCDTAAAARLMGRA
jgi:ketosteroid isomerase-like protein